MKTLNIAMLIILIGLTSCAENKLQTIPVDYTVGADESVIIGKLISDMGTVFGKKTSDPSEVELTIEHVNTGMVNTITCNKSCKESNFYVSLPPGQYRMTHWKAGNMEASPQGTFDVQNGQVIYIGTLRWVRKEGAGGFTQSVALSLLMGGKQTAMAGSWRVDDEYEVATNVFRDKYPQIHQQPVKSLIKIE